MAIVEAFQNNLPPIGAAIRNIIIFIAVMSIPLTAASAMGLSGDETSSWILALYGLPSLLSLLLTTRTRQPLLFTGNLFVIIFISGLEGQYSYPQLVGAAVAAGFLVLLVAALGITEKLASWIPVPIMFGTLAGAVLPFVSNLFSSLGESWEVVVGTLVIYLLSRWLIKDYLPPILPALITGLVITALTRQFQPVSEPLNLVLPEFTRPVFSLPVILTASPVFFVLITLQANLPSIRFLHSQDYQPPEKTIGILSGIGMMLGSVLGPTGVSLSLPATSLVAGKGAGKPAIRHRAVYLTAGAGLVVGLLSGIAVSLAGMIPSVLLLTLAGLSVVDVLGNALNQITKGPLLLGPVFALAIALSEISFLGFGNYFWSLVIGTIVSMLLEREGLQKLNQEKD